MFISGKYLVTVHRDPLPPLDEQRAQLDGRVLHSEQFLLYRVLDVLTDSFFPLLSDMDDEIDELEAALLENPTERQLQRLFELKRQLVAMRKVVTPQRDLFARSVDQIARAAGPAARRTRLLPRHLRPPDPDQRPDRLLPRPALRCDRSVSLDDQQPPERRDEAAHGDRDDLPPAVVHHRLLRSELRLHGHRPDQDRVDVLGHRRREHARDGAGLLVYFHRKGWV